ncbi:hypothetical protein QFZ58_005132 [Streptomyces sp. B1I3]|nr:hypothetical protein [Streptomyces sp. B1I3]
MWQADIRRVPLCAALLLCRFPGPGRARSPPGRTMYAATMPTPPGV